MPATARTRSARPQGSLKALAIGYLSRREYSRRELRGRLIEAARRRALANLGSQEAGTGTGTAPDAERAVVPAAALDRLDRQALDERIALEVDTLLDGLQAQGYLNDTRFVESRLNARAARHGTLRIKQELARHGLALDAGQAAALRETELARAREVWQRKFEGPAVGARERAAQARFLAARGFPADVVRRVIGGEEDPA